MDNGWPPNCTEAKVVKLSTPGYIGEHMHYITPIYKTGDKFNVTNY